MAGDGSAKWYALKDTFTIAANMGRRAPKGFYVQTLWMRNDSWGYSMLCYQGPPNYSSLVHIKDINSQANYDRWMAEWY